MNYLRHSKETIERLLTIPKKTFYILLADSIQASQFFFLFMEGTICTLFILSLYQGKF